jgi:RNA polymerase sigma factor (sigma-70 family)
MSTLLRDPEQTQTTTFDEFFKTHNQNAYRLAYRLTGGREAESQDLVQEAFFRLWRCWDSHRPESIKSWIYRVLQNLYVDTARGRKRHPTLSLEAAATDDFPLHETLSDQSAALDSNIDRQQLRSQVRRALTHMDPEFRTPVVLCDMEGLSYEEIARQLQCPVGTVRSRIHRGRHQLRRLLPGLATAIFLALGSWKFVHHCRDLEVRAEIQLAFGTWQQRVASHMRIALSGQHDWTQDPH